MTRPLYLERALKDLKKMESARRTRAAKKIAELKESNFPSGAKHLGMAERDYRLRSGDDRIVYRIREAIPEVVMVGDRNDIYQRLGRFV